MAVTVAAGGAKRSRLVRNELLLFSVLILIGFAVWTLYLFHARFGRKRSRLAMLYVFRSQCRKAPHFLKVSTSLLGVWKRLSFSIKSTETMEKNKVGKFVVMIQFLSNIVPLAEVARFIHSFRNGAHSIHFARFWAFSLFKPSFSVYSFTWFFLVFFGCPRFLLALTSRSRATVKTLLSSLLSTCPYHLIPFAVANPSTVTFKPCVSTFSSVVFLSVFSRLSVCLQSFICLPLSVRTWLFVLLKIAFLFYF